MEKLDILHQLFIRENETLLNNNEFDTLYDKAYIYFKDDAYIGELTDIFKQCGIDPIPSFLSTIPASFADSSKLIQHINLPSNIIKIGIYAFYSSSLETIKFDLDSKLKRIHAYAFSYSKLTQIKLPESVESIGGEAFAYCSELGDVYIPDACKSIGNYAFAGSDAVTINCHEGSFAQTYAALHNIAYKII